MVAPILARWDAAGFWLAVVLTGLGTGLAAAALTGLLELVQHTLWPGRGVDLLDAATKAAPWWHMLVLVGAGVLTGVGQLLLVRLSSANSIDITAAIEAGDGEKAAEAMRDHLDYVLEYSLPY